MNTPAKVLPANHPWKIGESLDLYQVEAWGKGYFSINAEGHVVVRPSMDASREIDLYDPTLSQRPWFIVANKMDLPGAPENLSALQNRFPAIDIVPVSAMKGEGIEELKAALAKWLGDAHEQDRQTQDRQTQDRQTQDRHLESTKPIA